MWSLLYVLNRCIPQGLAAPFGLACEGPDYQGKNPIDSDAELEARRQARIWCKCYCEPLVTQLAIQLKIRRSEAKKRVQKATSGSYIPYHIERIMTINEELVQDGNILVGDQLYEFICNVLIEPDDEYFKQEKVNNLVAAYICEGKSGPAFEKPKEGI
jgi:hypothetical protein